MDLLLFCGGGFDAINTCLNGVVVVEEILVAQPSGHQPTRINHRGINLVCCAEGIMSRKNLIDFSKVMGALVNSLEVSPEHLVLLDDFRLSLALALERCQFGLQDFDLKSEGKVRSGCATNNMGYVKKRTNIFCFGGSKLAFILGLFEGSATAGIVLLEEAVKLEQGLSQLVLLALKLVFALLEAIHFHLELLLVVDC